MELKVYKASAGSGKTYTLAKEFLRIALSDKYKPDRFRSILAVTFTNKATEEMKSRIIALLDALAKGKEGELAAELAKLLACTKEDVQARALRVRGSILHSYSNFSILTIDRFFQQVLQAFVREAGLRPGYTVELDTSRLLDEAIGKLMEDAGDDPQLRKWVFRAVEDNVDEGKTWDITPQLRSLGQEIFKESFLYFDKSFHEKLADKEALNGYIAKVELLVKEFEKQMADIGAKAVAYLQSQELTFDDFKYKDKGFVSYFYKLKAGGDFEPSKRVLTALDNVDEWSTIASPKYMVVRAAFHELNLLLNQAVELWNTSGIMYRTASVLYRNFKYLGLLSDISHNIQQAAGKDNLLLLSNSVYILSQLIGSNDTPFIYEKTGSRYHNFMIDEFQDTSAGQWANFRPLLHNSLAEGRFNMVVGDVKQSIYRWRNGDWKILGHQLADDFSIFGTSEEDLSANWRSDGVVIQYNNELFKRLASRLQASISTSLSELSLPHTNQHMLTNLISSAYSNISQQFSAKTAATEGYVSVEFFDDSEAKKSAEQVLEGLPKLIADIQDRGFSPSDIAILVRRGRDGQAVANTLLRHKQQLGDTKHCFDVVSQDSLYIANSTVAKMLISIFRIAVNPSDGISIAYLAHELAARNASLSPASMHSTLSLGLSDDDRRYIASLANMPLLDAFELAVQQFELNKSTDDLPFLQELHDVILSFSSSRLSDISSFLTWWDEEGSEKKVLAANDKQNAIRILTIHKSKGLQFKVVIVPFCNWSMVPLQNSIVWLSPKIAPFNEVEHIPVSYSSALSNTIFYEEYYSEKAQSYVDNLNLLYVAFTRAENELHVMVPMPSRRQDENIATLLKEDLCAAGSNELLFGELSGVKNGLHISFGQKKRLERAGREEKKNELELAIVEYPSSAPQNKLKIRLESQNFFNPEDASMEPRAYGSLMHRIFSKISTLDDVDKVMEQLQDEGLMDKKSSAFYKAKVVAAVKSTLAADWFSGAWELKNESEFILPKQKDRSLQIRRPDRVMIKGNRAVVVDYKFGNVEQKKYHYQVKAYMSALLQMGYADVKGYIWYVDMEKIEQV